MSNNTQVSNGVNDSSINFDEIDHKEILLFEISSSLESLKENVPGKKSLNLISEMQRMLNELEGTMLPNS